MSKDKGMKKTKVLVYFKSMLKEVLIYSEPAMKSDYFLESYVTY